MSQRNKIVDKIEQYDPQELAAHYTWKKRLAEVIFMIIYTGLMAVMIYRLLPFAMTGEYTLPLIGLFVFSMLFADLISGMVHWMADTWGTVEVPLLGPTLIKSFREHHVDPKAITRHDIIEANGDNCMVCIPFQIGAIAFTFTGLWPLMLMASFLTFFLFWIMLTNQVHKWAHLDEPPRWVRLMMKARLILSPEAHEVHHTPPFEGSYCITNGWLNPILDRVGWWRLLEKVIFKVTGLVPRENDIGTAAAVDLAISQGILPADYETTRNVVGDREKMMLELSSARASEES